ncbi:hypothetical protein T02_12363, partial [Trichinella nativa]
LGKRRTSIKQRKRTFICNGTTACGGRRTECKISCLQ